MSPIKNSTESFRPAFCQRADCMADPATPYCATCGADIAGYTTAMSAAHEPVGVTADGTIIQAPASDGTPAVRIGPVPGAAAASPAAEAPFGAASPARTPLWRDWAGWAAFAACAAVGAAAALLANLA